MCFFCVFWSVCDSIESQDNVYELAWSDFVRFLFALLVTLMLLSEPGELKNSGYKHMYILMIS